jgi:alpha-beta hydrolase superfamily lysophospholipase
VLAGLAALVLVWLAYKTTAMRPMSGRLTGDTGCESDPNTVAEISRFAPGAASIRCEPWDVGTGVTGYVWRAPNPRAVLLVEHGWGDYAQRYVKQFSELIPRLLECGISVYAIDMWGNGRSPGPRGATDIGNAVEDHLAARRKLRQQPLPVFVLGHSVGGLVTATSILRDQSGVRGMILLAPALKWGVSGFMRFVARMGGFLLPTLPVPMPPSDPTDQSRDMQFNARRARDPLMHLDNVSWVTAASGATISHANWEQYRHVAVPVLAVSGTADKVTDPSGIREFIEVVRSHDKTLSLVDGGRHSLLDDPPSNAEALQIVLGWLDRRLPGNDAPEGVQSAGPRASLRCR